jgi:hypothetical protein
MHTDNGYATRPELGAANRSAASSALMPARSKVDTDGAEIAEDDYRLIAKKTQHAGLLTNGD